MAHEKVIGVRLSNAELEKINALAHHLGINRSALIRELVGVAAPTGQQRLAVKQ